MTLPDPIYAYPGDCHPGFPILATHWYAQGVDSSSVGNYMAVFDEEPIDWFECALSAIDPSWVLPIAQVPENVRLVYRDKTGTAFECASDGTIRETS